MSLIMIIIAFKCQCFPLCFQVLYPRLGPASLKDSFIEECEILKEEIQSNELIVEGEYISEKTMLEEWNWTENLISIHHHLYSWKANQSEILFGHDTISMSY